MMASTDFIIYAQHGWADNHKAISKLAKLLATEQTLIITPNLGWLKTWWRIEPLIANLEVIVTEKINLYPHLPIKIIGHSMGGLIWLELLNRHPQWHSQIDSLVLIASPVGGADLARIIDPWQIGIGIARDLSKNRRGMAESIAQVIPTLSIAGDIGDGSDGTIALETTKFNYAKFVCFPDLSHAEMKSSPHLVPIIQEFWQSPQITPLIEDDFQATLIAHLRSTPSITDASYRHFDHAQTYLTFKNGIKIKTYRNLFQINHVFIANKQDECIYAGFVGWIHNQDLDRVLAEIKQKYNDELQN